MAALLIALILAGGNGPGGPWISRRYRGLDIEIEVREPIGRCVYTPYPSNERTAQ